MIVGGRSDAAIQPTALLGDGWLGVWCSPQRYRPVLDEIDELSLEHQVKLLRVIEDYTYRPIDSTTPRRFSGRLVASTHRSLAHLVSEGLFREDLYHRLNIYPINLPPLNQRGGDALLIFKYWFQRVTGQELRLDAGAR